MQPCVMFVVYNSGVCFFPVVVANIVSFFEFAYTMPLTCPQDSVLLHLRQLSARLAVKAGSLSLLVNKID